MSDPTATDKPGQLDLSSLRLMPDWVAGIGKEAPKQKFRDYEDAGGDRGGRRDDRGRSGGGRPFPGGRDDRGGRPGGPGGGGGRGREGFGGKGRGGPRDDRRGGGVAREFEQREPIPTDIAVTIEVEEKAADALAAHIKHTGRAFSMFDASRLVLESGERFHVKFACAAERPAGLFRVLANGALFLSRDEASNHILNSGVLGEYYRVEEIELEEPKGEFKSVGVCGMSGALLGPPSHHSYQAAIIRLHREKFSNLALDDFKRRIRVESDPELVTKWKEQQRKGTRWIYLKGQVAEGTEPLALNTRAEMEAHFRRTHTDDSISEVREAVVPGTGPKDNLAHPLRILLGRAVENARNHLFEFSQHLGHALEHRGLKLFKRRAGKLFVSRIRPKAVDPGVLFSERVTAIVETIKERPGIVLSKLIEAIAPGEAATEEPAAEAPKLSEAQIGVMKDLRWLADEGYIIEYSDGAVFLGVQGETPPAVKPAPKQPKQKERRPEAKPDAQAAAEPAVEAAAEPVETAAPVTPDVPSEEPVATPVEESAVEEVAAEVVAPAASEPVASATVEPATEEAVEVPVEAEKAAE